MLDLIALLISLSADDIVLISDNVIRTQNRLHSLRNTVKHLDLTVKLDQSNIAFLGMEISCFKMKGFFCCCCCNVRNFQLQADEFIHPRRLRRRHTFSQKRMVAVYRKTYMVL